MNRSAVHLVAVLALLVGGGLLPARALLGATPISLVAAPLLTALACSGGAVLSLVLRAALGPCVASVLVAAWVASLLVRQRGTTTCDWLSWARLGAFVAAVAVPLLAIRRAPVDWDARSIWFVHADWLWQGGADGAWALGNHALAFAHPDYPPLVPATVAAVWTVLGRDYELAQLTIAVLGAAATMAMAAAVVAVATGLPSLVHSAAGALVILATYGVAGNTATNGYADHLWAAAFAAAALLLLRPSGTDAPGLGFACIGVAMLTKNEGMVAGAIVVGLAAFALGWRRTAAWAWLPVLLSASWVAVSRRAGAESDMAGRGRFAELLSLDPDLLDRVRPTAAALWSWCRWELVVAALLTVVGLAVVRGHGYRLRSGSGWVWLAIVGCAGSLSFAYLISPHEIAWHLRTSVDRTTIAARLLLLAESAAWALVLGDLARGRAPAGEGAEPAMLASAALSPLPGAPAGLRAI